jgi:hypothetical protein
LAEPLPTAVPVAPVTIGSPLFDCAPMSILEFKKDKKTETGENVFFYQYFCVLAIIKPKHISFIQGNRNQNNTPSNLQTRLTTEHRLLLTKYNLLNLIEAKRP